MKVFIPYLAHAAMLLVMVCVSANTDMSESSKELLETLVFSMTLVGAATAGAVGATAIIKSDDEKSS